MNGLLFDDIGINILRKNLILFSFLFVFLLSFSSNGQNKRGLRFKRDYTKEDYLELSKRFQLQQQEKINLLKESDSLRILNMKLSDTVAVIKLIDLEKDYLKLKEKYDSLENFNSKVLKLLNNKQHYRVKRMLEKPKTYPKSPLKVIKNPEGKIGYKNKNGDVVIEPRFDFVWWMEDGFIKINENKGWGIIDTLGNIIIQPNYYYTTIPDDSICRVFKEGYWGYLDFNENWVIEPKFLGVSKFNSDTAMAIIDKDSIVYIDKKGKILNHFNLIPNSNSELTYDEFISEAEIGESYVSILSFLKYVLDKSDDEKYLMIQSPTDGEGTRHLSLKNLDFGIICETQYYYEGYDLRIRIPNLTFKEGLLLMIRILGRFIYTYEINKDSAIFKTKQGMVRIKLEESQLGYIEIFEEYSL